MEPTGLAFKLEGADVQLVFGFYADSRLALRLAQGHQPYAAVSVNLPEAPCGRYQFYAKEYAENRRLMPQALEAMVAKGWMVDTGRTASSGFVDAVRLFELVEPSLRAVLDKKQRE